MKTLETFIGVCLLMILSLPGFAQVELERGAVYTELFTSDNRSSEYITRLVHETEAHYYVYHYRIKKEKFIYVINKKDLTIHYRIEDPFRIELDGDTYKENISLDSNFYVLTDREIEDYHKALVLFRVSDQWWAGSEQIVLHEVQTLKGGAVHLETIADPNGRYLGVVELVADDKGRIKERLVVYDASLKMIAEKKMETTTRFNLNFYKAPYGEIKGLKEFYQKARFDDRGNIIIAANSHFLVMRADRDYELQVYESPSEGLGINSDIINMDFATHGDTILVHARLIESKIKTEYYTSRTLKIKQAATIGYYTLKISRVDYDIINEELYILEDDGSLDEDDKYGLWDAHVETVTLDDGGFLRISEKQRLFYGNRYGQLSLVKFDNHGRFEWARYIDKYMTYGSKYRFSIGNYSFQYNREGSDLRFIYYDWVEKHQSSISTLDSNALKEEGDERSESIDKPLTKKLMLAQLNIENGDLRTSTQDPLIDGIFTLNPFTYEKLSKQENRLILLSTEDNERIILSHYNFMQKE